MLGVMNQPTAALPNHLFRIPVYLPYLQPKLTREGILDAQSKLGVTLPAAYVATLEVQNGGYLRLSQHPTGHAPVNILRGIGPRYPSLLAHKWAKVKAYMEENQLETPQHIDELLPFCGDGHYYWCFDYRKDGRHNEPRISYIDVETFDTDEVVAPDFLTFLHALRADVEIAHGIVSQNPIETVALALSEATGYRFEDQGDEMNGYRVFRAKLPGAARWAWLTPNRVIRGFVRKNEPDYKVLSTLMPDFALRYPEHADCDYFVTTKFDTTEGQAFAHALTSLPYQTRPVELS
jgi:hypothetical protein